MGDGKRDDDGKHSYSQQCQDAETWTLNIFTYRIQMFRVHMQVDSVITVIGPRFVVVAVMTVSGALVHWAAFNNGLKHLPFYNVSEYSKQSETLPRLFKGRVLQLIRGADPSNLLLVRLEISARRNRLLVWGNKGDVVMRAVRIYAAFSSGNLNTCLRDLDMGS
jgi:predicted tellurium resistance membrane protein TerC